MRQGAVCLWAVAFLATLSATVGGPLTVNHACERASSKTTLKCASSKQFIEIKSANWGRTDANLCSELGTAKVVSTECRSDVTGKIVTLCDGQSSCVLPQDIGVLGDPCVGVDKYLSVQWSCEPSVASSISVAVSPAGTVTPGAVVSFTGKISVDDANQELTGVVRLLEGAKTLTAVTLVTSKGSANFTITFNRFPKGSHALTISYSGQGDVKPASVDAIVNVDGKAATHIMVEANKLGFKAHKILVDDKIYTVSKHALVLSGRLSAADGTTPQGSVHLYQVIENKSGKKKDLRLGAARIAPGSGKFLFVIHRLAVGKRALYVRYRGSKKYLQSSSKVVTVEVTADPNEPDPTRKPKKHSKKKVLQALDLAASASAKE